MSSQYSQEAILGREVHGRISGEIGVLSVIRGVFSRSMHTCRRDTLYFLPMASRVLTILGNSGREAGCSLQHCPMTLASSFVHGWLLGISGLLFSSDNGAVRDNETLGGQEETNVLKTRCRTASSSSNGQGRAPLLRISTQQIANAYTSIGAWN